MSIVHKSEILIPKNIDFNKWSVIACDQFTSQPSYWEKLANIVGDSPSTLKITYPEIYLNDHIETRIEKINKAMESYLSGDVFEKLNSFVLVERTVASGKKRVSLVVSVDLESYDYRRVRAGIRATEDTIMERLPVRIRIRKKASIELPHIILLMDDTSKEIIEPLYEQKENLRKLYDFELNMNGGHIVGYEINNREEIIAKFDKLLQPELQKAKYGNDAGIEFAVGDGNHSMATAKEHWNNIKKTLTESEIENHPARYCLVEILNIYDEGLIFEPIHRVIMTKNRDEFLNGLKNTINGEGSMTIVTPEKDFAISCPKSSAATITAVQEYIENMMAAKMVEVDYVHGLHHLREVVKNNGGIGIIMPQFAKDELFNYVINVGNLPKKAFSIGTAENKKYYLEAKRIK
ncbi:MAG TPA: DUF1015 domain-containing protein [Clostridia bacterium]|nr:DUF1015 domain-containing protein [Clostridia bacterium]